MLLMSSDQSDFSVYQDLNFQLTKGIGGALLIEGLFFFPYLTDSKKKTDHISKFTQKLPMFCEIINFYKQ